MNSSTHGALESIILNALWSEENTRQYPISVKEVQDRINSLSQDKKWAYTTVKTVLDRLADKALIDRVKFGKKFLYVSVIAREELGRQAIRNVCNQFYNGDLTEMLRAVEAFRESEEALTYALV